MTGSVVRVVCLMTISLTVVKSDCEIFPLDMANDSVDDSYESCRDGMKELVMSKLIFEDDKRIPGFKAAWEKALQNSIKGGLSPNQSAAVYLYTTRRNSTLNWSYEDFNKATRNGSVNYMSGNFSFYTLHFFLTYAIQELKKNQTECVTTYRRTNVTFKVLSQRIRFGSFASSSKIKNLTGFGNVSCFKIRTCFGADVTEYSTHKDEQEVLIPPYEVFNITAIEDNTWCKVVYRLKSVRKQSNLQYANSSSAPLPSVLLPVLLLALFLV